MLRATVTASEPASAQRIGRAAAAWIGLIAVLLVSARVEGQLPKAAPARKAPVISVKPARITEAKAVANATVVNAAAAAEERRANDAWSAPVPVTAPPRRLSAHLEENFAYALQQCGIPQLKRKVLAGLRERDLSAIPPTLQGAALPLNAQLGDTASKALGFLLGYVYDGNEEPVKTKNFVAVRSLDLDVLADPATMLPKGTSTVVYTQSCSSIVQAALSLKLDIPAPIVKAALDASAEKKESMDIALIEGTFRSPIANHLASADATSQLFGRLTLWDWYRRNPGAIATGGQYIENYPGVALIRLFHSKTSANLKASANGGVAVPFASFDASAQAAFTRGEGTAIEHYITAPYMNAAGNPSYSPQPMPAPAALASLIRAAAIGKLETPAGRIVFQGMSLQHEQRFAGVPRSLCQLGVWIPAGMDAKMGTVSVVGAVRDSDVVAGVGVVPACRLQIEYTPSDTAFARRDKSVTLAYTLVNKIGAGKDTASLVLDARPVPLNTSLAPTLAYKSGRMYTTTNIEGSGKTLSWNVRLAVVDAGNPVDFSVPLQVNTPSMVCHVGSADSTFTPAVTYSLNPGNEVSLTATLDRFPVDSLDYASPAVRCHLGGVIVFGAKPAGRTIERNVPDIELLYPAHLPARQPMPTTAAPVTPPAAPQPAAPQPARSGGEKN